MRFNVRRASCRQPKLKARHDRARRRATSGPIAPAVPRPAPQAAADPFAFGAVLDSLPGASAKADASTAEEQPGPSNESPQEDSSRGQTARHSLLNDSALLAALPFALRAASMMNERPQAADSSPSLASPAMKGPKSEDSGASIAAGAKAATVGRLVGERAFHFGPSTFAGAIASRTLGVNAPFAPGAASAANLTAATRSRRRKRRCFRLFAGRGHASESLGRRRSADCKRGVSDADRSSLGRAPNTSRDPHSSSRTRSRAHRAKARRLGVSACRPGRDLRRSPRASGIERQGGRRSAPRPGYLRRSVGGANRPVRRAAFGALLRRGVVPTRRLDGQRRTSRRHAPRERARRWLRALGSADPGDRRRSFAGRPRGCLDDDAARGRQTLCRHPRREFSNARINRRRARRDRRSNGGDRPAARLAHRQAGGCQHRWECERKWVFR